MNCINGIVKGAKKVFLGKKQRGKYKCSNPKCRKQLIDVAYIELILTGQLKFVFCSRGCIRAFLEYPSSDEAMHNI